MVEIQKENTKEDATCLIDILRKAEEDGSLAKIAKRQHVDLDEIEERFRGLETEGLQMKLLQDEYPCLYLFVCGEKGIDTAEYIKEC